MQRGESQEQSGRSRFITGRKCSKPIGRVDHGEWFSEKHGVHMGSYANSLLCLLTSRGLHILLLVRLSSDTSLHQACKERVKTNSSSCRTCTSVQREEQYRMGSALDLLTHTNYPATSHFINLDPDPLSKCNFLLFLPHFQPHSSFLILFSSSPPAVPSYPTLVYHSLSFFPVLRQQLPTMLFPLLTNSGVRPGTTQVRHEQVGGSGREREGAPGTVKVPANTRPPTQAQTVSLLAGRHKA